MKKDSRVKAVISLDAVEHNFREMRKNIAEETKMIAVIKADAYGHGAVPVAHLIEDYDYIWGFAAATAEEAIHLREAGITKPILILGIVFDEYFPELVRYEIRPAVCEYEEARKLSDEAVLQKKTVHIHIALDTGMTRIGFADAQENVEEIKKFQNFQILRLRVCLLILQEQMSMTEVRLWYNWSGIWIFKARRRGRSGNSSASLF